MAEKKLRSFSSVAALLRCELHVEAFPIAEDTEKNELEGT
jgi:hypothetical protein